MEKGKIFIISGPSGSGKTTFYNKLLTEVKFRGKLVKSISVTTRNKRDYEKHGRDYFFVSTKMFNYKKNANHFLESMKVFDNYYGTPKKSIRDILNAGKNVLLCIDVKGSRVVAKRMNDVVRIFVKTPSLMELKRRLVARDSEDAKTIQLRLNTAKEELKDSPLYDHVVVNDQLSTAYKQIAAIIGSHIHK
ncbi:MAG: guanylate kinase [Lysobacterales bacterium]|jgi:guanylate kinase